ncbi:MAG TPA: hypothetical protein VM008_09860 [Phycisphaerae bacterium]|nr:hypothetical protein [Phycisphaerae bacterium]
MGFAVKRIAVSVLAIAVGMVDAARADEGTANHPTAAEGILQAVLKENSSAQPTGVKREDYLRLMAGDVDYFKKYQRADGAIIDPFSHKEVQYSTPAFALEAGTLAVHADRKDLLTPACKAMSCALTALVNHEAADGHSDFYIPLLVHGYGVLKERAPKEMVSGWEGQFKTIVPEKTYNMKLIGMNWNIVSCSGELLRRKAGLVAANQMGPQWEYLERALAGHLKDITEFGLFVDPGAPLAYDAFSRLWLEDMMAEGAYGGESSKRIEQSLQEGAESGLVLLSPSGEWANGGRSALHNWNEAENAVIFEIAAGRAKGEGHAELAEMFKRGAHLAFESMQRWVRPTGELWIIKNRAEPGERLGYETYSGHSQYNLLPMAMLAMAYSHADETIGERAIPSEVGGYVFDLRDHFHKIAAAAGGYYVLIDTGGDPHYNATGLQRVHRAGVAFPALSDSVAGDRAYEPKEAAKEAVAPGIAWKEGNGEWRSLAEFSGSEHGGKYAVGSVDLHLDAATPGRVAFETDYVLAGPGEEGRHVVERYVLSADGVECTTQVVGGSVAMGYRAEFPVLVSDGAKDLAVKKAGDAVEIDDHGSRTTIAVRAADAAGALELVGPRLVNHNGWVERGVVPLKGSEVTYTVTLEAGK